MSDLRSLYYKALFDPVPQSVDDLATRYQSLKTAILNRSQEREDTYKTLFKYTDIRTLLQLPEAEKNEHLSALDEIFYKLTRNLQVLKPPPPLREHPETHTMIFNAYLNECGDSRTLTQKKSVDNALDLIKAYPSKFIIDVICVPFEVLSYGLGVIPYILVICIGLVLLSPGIFLCIVALYFFYIVERAFSLLVDDVDEHKIWSKEKYEREMQMITYEKQCEEMMEKLRIEMQDAQTAPPGDEETARVSL
jgi:uncharacterized protein Veg